LKPVVQVALDFVDLSRASRVAAEASAAGVTWLEAGTPLIKAEGLSAVRALREGFPKATIIADMKTMDAGRAEVEAAARAGADVVCVLGVASDATIRECVEAGRNLGARIFVDTLGTADPVARAKQAEAMGADIVGVHCPIDEQMEGRTPFETLKKVASAVGIPVAVAGGINSESAADAVAAGASIVIVGGAVIKSAEATAAARAVLQAVETGAAVRTDLYKRAGEGDLAEAFCRVSCANISDAMHHSGDLPGIGAVVPGARMAGPAVTVRTLPGDWAKTVEAIDEADAGSVIVVDCGGVGPAVWGELASHSALQAGLAGVVVNGAVRDVGEIRAMGFPAFATLIMPTSGEPRGHGEINVPLRIGGVDVRPGDWVVGDDDGVVVVPGAKSVEVCNRAADRMEFENRVRAEIEAGSTLARVVELSKWEKVG